MKQELSARVSRELESLVEELTVHIPARLGTDHAPVDYAAITGRQHWILDRIRHLRQITASLSNLSSDAVSPDRIGFGSIVSLLDQRTGESLEYTLMVGTRLDAGAGEISLSSSLGQALLGRRPGAEVTLKTPQEVRRLRIVSVRTLLDRLDQVDEPGADPRTIPGVVG